MKILVISGFLGAGKTTFIRELAKRTKRDFAVMENEYGAVNVDGDLLEKSGDGSLNIWELTEGCICCSMQADFATSILTIANTVDPEYLIVEPTGVGMLSKIIKNIKKIEYERITLLEPITILDGMMYERCMREFEEICKDQIQSAGRILVSKMEHADSQEQSSLQKRLEVLNPGAEICVSHYSGQDDAWWDSLLTSYLDQELPKTEEQKLNLENLGLTEVGLQTGQELLLFLQGIVSGVFGDICRAKGYLPVGKGWLQFDVTDHTYSITGIEEMPESKCIFIGKELKRNWLREVLQKELYVQEKNIRRALRPMRKKRSMTAKR